MRYNKNINVNTRGGQHHITECAVIEDSHFWESCEVGYQTLTIEIPPASMKYRFNNMVRGIHDSFGWWNCRHSHDCCGCIRGRVKEVTSLGANQYMVLVKMTRNV